MIDPSSTRQPRIEQQLSDSRDATTAELSAYGANDKPRPAFEVRELSVYYGEKTALSDITIDIPEKNVTAIIGPSGCGKSTFLRCLNRMHELVPRARVTGDVYFDGENLYGHDVNPTQVRRRIGMIFQKSNPFPTMSIADNVLVGLRLNGVRNRRVLNERLEQSLRMSALWEEVKDDLHKPGTSLSGGQQQRLCIARAIAVRPDVVLMDEPASALDPIATMKVEELIRQLRHDYTIVIVTHNMQQASRVSDYTGFFYMGELVEFDRTERLFSQPKEKRTEDYITGRFG